MSMDRGGNRGVGNSASACATRSHVMSLAAARRADGYVEVGPTLQVVGQMTVFALGDLSTADVKMAAAAGARRP